MKCVLCKDKMCREGKDCVGITDDIHVIERLKKDAEKSIPDNYVEGYEMTKESVQQTETGFVISEHVL